MNMNLTPLLNRFGRLPALLLVWLLAAVPALAQQTITIGTGTTGAATGAWVSSSTTTNRYSRTAAVYSAAEINAAGGLAANIVSLAYYKVSTGTYPTADAQLRIWMQPWPTTTMTGTQTWATLLSTATQVFSTNTQSFPQATPGWITLNLDAPYFYNASENVMIMTEWYRPSSVTSDVTWQYTSTPSANASGINTTAFPATITVGNNRPNIQLGMAASGPYLDLGLSGFTSPGSSTNTSYQPVLAVRNFGNITIDSFQLAVTLNGAPAGNVGITQSIAAGTSASVTLPNLNIIGGANQITARLIKVNGTFPDRNSRNDSTGITVQFCASQLAGTYTINPNAPGGGTNYTTFRDFITQARLCGLSGPVVLNVSSNSGTIAEQVDFSRITTRAPGATITINGNGVNLVQPSLNTNLSGALFHVAGTSDLIVNNLNLVQGSYTYALRIGKRSDNVTWRNSRITGNTTLTTSTYWTVMVADSTNTIDQYPGDNIVLENNTIIGGYYGVRAVGGNKGNRPGQRGFTLRNNTITAFYNYGVYVYAMGDGFVTNNRINRIDVPRTSVTIAYGIYLLDSTANMRVTNNRIHDLWHYFRGQNSTTYGMYISADATPGRANVIANNIIQRNVGSGSTFYGMYAATPTYLRVQHNTIEAMHDSITVNVTSGMMAGMFFSGRSDSTVIENNLIAVGRQGTGTILALALTDTLSQLTIRNNNYFVKPLGGTNVALVRTGNTTATYRYYTSIAAWNAQGGRNYDAGSRSLDPEFVDYTASDVTPNSFLIDNMGTFVGITTDFANNPRSTTTPDVGAIEFSAVVCPRPSGAVVLSAGIDTASVRFNTFNQPGTFIIEWGVTGFSPGSGTLVTVTDTNFVLRGLPDNSSITFFVRRQCGTTLTPYGTGTTFMTKLRNDDPCGAVELPMGTGGVCNFFFGSTMNASFTTPRGYSSIGCGNVFNTSPIDVWFRFTTPASGQGSNSAVLTVAGNNASQARLFAAPQGCNGNFNLLRCKSSRSSAPVDSINYSDLTPGTTYYIMLTSHDPLSASQGFNYSICLTDQIVTDAKPVVSTSPIKVYPNPVTSGRLSLELGAGMNGQGTVNIYNTAGQLVHSQPASNLAAGEALDLDVSRLPRGIYNLQVVSETGRMSANVSVK